MKKKITLLLFMFSMICIQGHAQTQFWSDTFETGPSSGTRTPEENGGLGSPSTSYFRLTDGTTISQVVPFSGKQGTNYWAGEDHNAAGTGFTASGAEGAATNSPSNELSISWTSINIAGKTGLSFRGLFAANSTNEPWDNTNACLSGVGTTNTDYIIVQYRIDGGAYVDLIRFYNKGSATNGVHKYLFEDTDGNGCGDGTQLTNAFGEFTKTIPATGTTLEIKINVYSEGTSEEWAIDNFRLFETPTCVAPTITGNPPNRAICVNNNTTFSVSATGATAYQWQVNTGSGFTDISNGGVYSGATTTTLTITGATAGMTGYSYRAVAINGVVSCFTNSNSATLTISNITSTGSQTNVSCNGGSNGNASVTPGGGIPGYTYSWSPSGGTGAIATGLSAGSYTVTITDAIGCTATRNYTITQPPAISTSTASQTNVACFGGTNGAASVTPSGGAGGYSYSWSPSGGTGATATGLSAGSYTVTVTDANGCIATRNYTITQPAAPVSGSTVVTNVACFGGTNGAINLTPTGGTGPYSFNWGGGITTEDRTGLAAGSYSVTITDANGCTGTVSGITVTQPAAPVSGSTVVTNVACFGGTNGAINLTPTGGTGPYTFNWGGGITTEDRTGLAAGSYSVTITDANGCTGTVSGITVTQPAAPVSGSTVVTNVACFGGTNGAINLTPTGGTGPYTFNWGGGITTEDRTGLAAGSYSVTITDANGCTGTVSGITVTQPAAPVSGSTVVTNVACFGGTNGAINLTPTGGTGPYTFNWGGGITTEDRTGLAAGSYSVTITDANGCTGTVSGITVTQPAAPVSGSTVVTNVACFGGTNGAINLTPSGGTGPYTFNWGGGITTEDRTGLAAGTYSVIITDANGCTGTVSGITVTQPAAPVSGSTVVTNVACFGGTNGAINLTPTGGTGPYTFNWGGGITTEDRTGLAAGTYSVIITDANGCTGTVSGITVTQPAAVVSGSTVVTNVACFGGTNGAINLTPSGGTGPYTFNWGGGITTEDRTGLAAGTYSVIITDANGCTGTVSGITVTQPTAISTATGSQTNVACNGGANGSATVAPSGGTPGYTYSWSPSGGTAAAATGLAAGSYTVTVTDANGCTATRNYTITQPTAISTATGSQTNVSCNGGTNGSATVAPSGGTPGYTYSWSPSGGTAATATGLAAGSYTVTVTDANGCTATRNYTITQPSAINTTAGSQTNVTCNGGSNGSATVAPSGGTPGYTYSWSPSGGTAATATGLAAGSYTVTITDANGCTATRSYTITEPSAITAIASQTNVSCNGGSNGSATVIVSGGTPGYTYSWAPSGGTAATASGLSAGTYTVTMTDANGCTATETFTITAPSAITAIASQTNVSCNGGSNGSATVIVSGGTPGYTYSWAPSGGTAATASGLSAGTYTVTMTDANGCTATETFTITAPSAITAIASQTNVSCNGGSNGSATVIVSGGTPGYTYSWAPSGGTSATASGLSAGTYTVTMTDANGCTATETFTITAPSAITAIASQTNISCNGGSNGSATVIVSGGAPGYTYSWAPSGGTAATASGLSAGTYTVTMTDANGCTATETFTITEPSAITAIASQTNVSCNGGSNGSATVIVSGGTPGYTYSWAPSGGTAATASGLSAGTYTVTMTDANGCTATETFTITEPGIIDNTVALAGTTLTANQGGATYQWIDCDNGNTPIGGATSQSYTPIITGNYAVIVTVGSCSATSSCTVVLDTENFELHNEFIIYPNPSNGIINIKSDFDGHFQIVNQLGQIIKAFDAQAGIEKTIAIENVSDGIYYLIGQTNNGTIVNKKIILNQ